MTMDVTNQVFERISKLKIAPVNAYIANETSSSSSAFANVATLPPDAIFFTKQRFKEDKDPRKINLGIGAYRTEEGKPYVLKVVKKVEAELLVDDSLNKEYLPIGGDAGFVLASQKSILGNNSKPLEEGRVAGVQALSGTGSLRIVGNLIKNILPGSIIYKSSPTWGNHKKIFAKAGLQQRDYRYWDPKTRGLDFDGMIADLENAPARSVILLHACAHNPTGVDPTQDQWKKICQVVKKRSLIPFFDSAYQGYASGSLDKDAFAVRYFVEQGCEMFIAQSFSKNLGLYGERAGCVSVITSSQSARKAVDTQLRAIIRPMYSNPPKHGAYIAKTVLTKPERFKEWVVELSAMSNRILSMRSLMRKALEDLNTPGTWNHITDQIGMFSYTGLTAKQVAYIEKTYHVYMLSSGRVSMAGVTSKNVKYICEAINDAVRNQ